MRISVALFLTTILAWATLPWWLPKEFIRQKIVADLARQMGVAVKIDALSVSWAQGVEISGLSIDSPEGFTQKNGSEPMIEIEKLRCDFSPVDLLLEGHIDWMEIINPKIRAVVDVDGNLNLAVLKKFQPAADAQRISINNAELSLQLPEHPRKLLLRIGDLELSQGKLNQIGRITMTASLDQNGTHAPINLRMSSGAQNSSDAIVAAFHFANLDLSQIPLPREAQFPIRSLTGRCSGKLAFKISDNLQVEQLSLELLVRKLKVTLIGKQNLPTLDQAGLKLTAAVDSPSELINLSSIRLHLPGLDISGSADVYADILTDGFDAVERFNFQGQVQPSQLTAMLTGQRELPGRLNVDGQLDLSIRGKRSDEVFSLTSTTRADNIIIRRDKETIKPREQKMKLDLDASFQPFKNSWVVNIQKCKLALGKNTLTAMATIIVPSQPNNTGPVTNSVIKKSDPLQEALGAIEFIRTRGTIEISRLDALRNLLPPEERSKLQFDGVLSGTWFVGGGRNSRVRTSVRAGAKTKLRFGDILHKPQGQEMTIETSFIADLQRMRLDDLAIEYSVDNSRVGLSEATLQLPKPGQDLKIKGNFEVNGLEKILTSLPILSMENITLGQSLDGFFAASLGDGKTDLTCSANLRLLDIRAGDLFMKASGKPLDVTVKIQGNSNKAGDEWIVTSRGKTLQAKLDIQLKHNTQNSEPTTSLVIGGNINDMTWLRDSSPALSRILKGTKPQGKLKFAGRLKKIRNKIEFLLACDSDKLDFLKNSHSQGLSFRSEPLILNIKGSFNEQTGTDGRKIELVVDNANLQFNNQKLNLRKFRIKIQPGSTKATNGQAWPVPGVEELTGEISLTCDLTKLREEITWQDKSIISLERLGGKLVANGQVSLSNKKVSISLEVNGKEAFFRNIAGLTKAAGIPGKFSLLLTAASDLSTLQVRNFQAQLGDVHFQGDAQAKLLRNQNGLPIAINPTKAHLALWSNRAKTLAELFPACKPYNPAGDFFADISWKGPPGGATKIDAGAISTATFHARSLQGVYRGRPVMAGGKILLENIRFTSGIISEIARFHTDDLEFRAGKNHGWLLANIRSVLNQPTGNFHALLEYLDVKDLTDWLSDPVEKKPFSKKMQRGALAQAEDIIASLNKSLSDADIRGRISAETFGIFDEKVRQHYLTQQFELDLTIKESKIDLTYMTGVCGGLTRGRLSTELGEKIPSVTSHVEFANVISTPSIQPQIMMFFPGNTVSGTFSRDEDITYPLRDMIANAIDSRYRIIPVGKAKMVAIDGVVVGRSAPKFITNVFPGLNLTKYPYRTMTGYSKFLPDGMAENETFFFGDYDIYMEGTTDVDNFVKYSLGLILFGSTFSPDALRDWKQGRIPILKVKGRIKGGKLVEETVSYPLPNETLFEIFLKNNLVFRTWININNKPRQTPSKLP